MEDLWAKIASFFSDLDWPHVVKSALGQLAAIVVSLFVAWFVFLRHYWRLWAGDSDDILYQAQYLIPRGDQFVLVFRTVAPPTTIRKVYDNVASQKHIRKLADATTLDDPVLQTSGLFGFEVVNDLVNQISGHLALTSHAREEWLLAVTCEDRKVAKKKCIRVFLVRPADLTRFADWTWCKEKILVESPWHFFRILALHRLALDFQTTRSASAASNAKSDREMLVTEPRGQFPRIRTLSLGLAPSEIPIGAPTLPHWEEATRYLQSIGAKTMG